MLFPVLRVFQKTRVQKLHFLAFQIFARNQRNHVTRSLDSRMSL